MYGDRLVPETAAWLLTKMRCWLTHLERTGRAAKLADDPERWRAR